MRRRGASARLVAGIASGAMVALGAITLTSQAGAAVAAGASSSITYPYSCTTTFVGGATYTDGSVRSTSRTP